MPLQRTVGRRRPPAAERQSVRRTMGCIRARSESQFFPISVRPSVTCRWPNQLQDIIPTLNHAGAAAGSTLKADARL